MNHSHWLYLGCLVLLFFTVQAQTDMHQDRSELFEKHFKNAYTALDKQDFETSLAECRKAQQYNANHYLTHAIVCLDYYNMAEILNVKNPDHKQQKIKFYQQMVEEADRGIKADPDKGECYFFRGLAHARLSTTNGILYSLFMAKSVENDWLKATTFEPAYKSPEGVDLKSSAHIALSVYYRLCPTFFLWQIVFGIHGDSDKSVYHAQRAYAMDPRIEITKEYGISLIARGLKRNKPEDIALGKTFLEKVITMPAELITDPIDISHAKMLLQNIQLCPGYSRDQQQILQEDALSQQ